MGKRRSQLSGPQGEENSKELESPQGETNNELDSPQKETSNELAASQTGDSPQDRATVEGNTESKESQEQGPEPQTSKKEEASDPQTLSKKEDVEGLEPNSPPEGSEPKQPPKQKGKNSLIELAMSVPISACVTLSKEKLSEEQANEIVQKISIAFAVPPAIVVVAIWILFLRGAANKGVPDSIFTEMNTQRGLFCLSKRDLKYHYESVAKNGHLRRLAEYFAKDIGEYAHKNGLDGDLATKINNLSLSKNLGALTKREKAFASSFSQSIPNLEELVSPKLAQLLADDYNSRFNKPGAKNKVSAPALTQGNQEIKKGKAAAKSPNKKAKTQNKKS
jgi:hypothetical protein